MEYLLTIITFMPLLGVLLILFIPREDERTIKNLATGLSVIPLLLSVAYAGLILAFWSGAEGGFEHRRLAMSERNGDLAQRFVGGILTGQAHEVGRAIRFLAQGDFKRAVGLFRLVEEFGLRLAALQGGEKTLAEGHGMHGFPVRQDGRRAHHRLDRHRVRAPGLEA